MIAEHGNDGEVDLLDYLSVVWRNKVSIISAATATAFVLGVSSFLLPNQYRAEVLIAPAVDSSESSISASGALGALGAVGGLLGQPNLFLGSGSDAQVNLAVLRSRSFVWRFVDEQRLMPLLFPQLWDDEEGAWREPERAPGKWDAYELIIEDGLLSVTAHDDSGLYTLAVQWPDPELAAEWANSFVSRLNEFLREREREETTSNLAYLNLELQRTQVAEIRESLFGLITQELNRAMLANTQQEFAFRVLDPAVTPEEHVSPNRPLIAAVGGVLAALAAIFVAFLREGIRREKMPAVSF